MTQERIGIFDSGVGGISILNKLLNGTTLTECVYVADTAYLPYGDKSKRVLLERGRVVTNTLLSYGITTIIVACHTSSATTLPILQKEFPQVTFIDMLAPTVIAAASLTHNNNVGVIATSATIANHSHKTILKTIAPDIELFEQACPLLVPLIEEQKIATPESVTILKNYLEPLHKKNIDTLILGCTHYAFLEDTIKQIAPHLTLISARSCTILKQINRTDCKLIFLTSNKNKFLESNALNFLNRKNIPIELNSF